MNKVLRGAELAVAVALSVVAACLFCLNAVSAGPLWRDEANTIGLTTLPSFSEVWANLEYDSFPILWMSLIRGIASVAGAGNDAAFRILGLIIGLLLIASLWINARSHRYAFPIISLALIGLSPSVIKWGGSLRAYGLGMTAAVVTSAALWMYVQEPRTRRLLIAALCALLSVHILYYNAPVIFSLCMAAGGVCAIRRRYAQVIAILGLGLVAAASLLIYVPTFSAAASWNPLVQIPNYDFRWFMYKLNQTVAAGPSMTMTWIFLVLMAACAATLELRRNRLSMREDERGSMTFALVLMLVGIITQYVFLKQLSYVTQPWYYLTLLAMSAISIDIIFARLATNDVARMMRLSIAVVIAAVTIPASLNAAREPVTNVDKVARMLERSVTVSDIVVLSPWYLGVSFSRYYDGRALWIMLPTAEFYRFHRYSQIRDFMLWQDQRAPAEKAVVEALRALKNGGTVYFVDPGELTETRAPQLRGPAVLPEEGWKASAYQNLWTAIFVHEMRKHATAIEPINTALTGSASKYESLHVTAIRGWRD